MEYYSGPSQSTERVRTGWATFVALYLLVAGLLNLLWGIAALADKDYFIENGLLWSSLSLWGWVALILGSLQLLGTMLIFSGNALGAVIAITLSLVGIVVNFLSLGAYPWWSAVLLVVNGLILWAVSVHGEEFVSTP